MAEKTETIDNKFSGSDYVKSELVGHGFGGIVSTAGTFLLETAGFGSIASLSAGAEALDFAGDELGFNSARYYYQRKLDRYSGLTGKIQYFLDSVDYGIRHIPGKLFGGAAAAAVTFGIATYGGLSVYLAQLVPRVAEWAIAISTNYFATKGYRGISA